MDWQTLLAYITGSVDQELLLRNEYLTTENRILRDQIKGRFRLRDGERQALADIGQKLGKQALQEVATIVKPDTILAWHRKPVAQKCDGSQQRRTPGRPRIDEELEALVIRMAQENRSWGYDRIVGALANLGYTISDQTVGNILKRHGITPAPARKTTTTWKEFIRTHMDVLVATDFFTAEVWTLGGLVTYYVLFFIHLGSRQVHIAGMTPHPNAAWMVQVARNVTMEEWGVLSPGQYLLHDRDGKYCPAPPGSSAYHCRPGRRISTPTRSGGCDRSRRNACRASSSLGKRHSAMHRHNMWNTFITSAIIKARATCCSFLQSATTQSVKARCSVVNGLGGC
jgi:putative transposase